MDRVVVVCLPPDVAPADLTSRARGALAAAPFSAGTSGTAWHPVAHFATRRRGRTRRLVQAQRRSAAGGPARLLDLTGMQLRARAAAWHRWHVWQDVVSGTPKATPWWVHAARHRSDPSRHPLARVRQDYASQPRIHAMRTHNILLAHPYPPVPTTRWVHLPTEHLEAFQAGAHAYTELAFLTAIAPHGLLTLDHTPLRPASDQLADHLTYLDTAHHHLTTLTPHHQLLALTTGHPTT